MNEGDPGKKNQEMPKQAVNNQTHTVVGESGDTYTNVQVFNKALGMLTDHLVSDGPQPATLAEGE